MATYTSSSPNDTAALGRRLAAKLRGGDTVALIGAMGSGKTTFCAGLAEGLGTQDAASSPSFAIVNLYRGAPSLAHFDAWRITGPEDLETAGYYDYLDAGAVLAVEWADRVADWLEPPRVRVSISITGEGERSICIEGEDLS